MTPAPLLLAAAALAAGLCGGEGRKARAMDQIKVGLDRVEAFEDPGSGAEARLRLKDGTACTLDRAAKGFDVWSRLIQKQQAAARPIYVECDSQSGRARTVLPVAMRRVESVAAQPDGDRLKVLVFMSPSAHFVRTTRPDLGPLRQRLEQSAAAKAPLLLAVHPETLEILDARQPPPDLKMPVI